MTAAGRGSATQRVPEAPSNTGRDTGDTVRASGVDESTGSLVRSEERLRVSTTSSPVRRVRLEKYVVTEVRMVPVEVSREEYRIVELDIADHTETADPTRRVGFEPNGIGRWITLSEERIDITTVVVTRERVRLQIDTVTENRVVNESVLSERVEVDPTSYLGTPNPAAGG